MSLAGIGFLTPRQHLRVWQTGLLTLVELFTEQYDLSTPIVVFSMRSVELPKTTHLPKTTENHLENQVYMGIMPS